MAHNLDELKRPIYEAYPGCSIEVYTQPEFPGTRTARVTFALAEGRERPSWCACRKDTEEEAIAGLLETAREFWRDAELFRKHDVAMAAPESNDLDTSREAFMAAIVKLADDEAFRRSFLTHYQLWLHPPMIATRDDLGNINIDYAPGAITFVSGAQLAARAYVQQMDESRANIERIMRDSAGAP